MNFVMRLTQFVAVLGLLAGLLVSYLGSAASPLLSLAYFLGVLAAFGVIMAITSIAIDVRALREHWTGPVRPAGSSWADDAQRRIAEHEDAEAY